MYVVGEVSESATNQHTFLVVVHHSELGVDVGAGTKPDQTEVGVVGQGVVHQLKLQGGLCQEEVPQPVLGHIQAVQLHICACPRN